MKIDDREISRFLFHPRPEDDGLGSSGIPTSTASEGAMLGGYLHACPGSATLLAFFHGNGELAIEYDSLAPFFAQCGVWFWPVDYRGYGRSTGTPSLAAMFRDAEALFADIPAVEHLAGVQFSRIIVMGRSLGSASALQLASSHAERVHGLVLDSAYANGLELIQRLGGPTLASDDLPGYRDNANLMASCRVPTLILHGTDDDLIPIEEAEALLAACPSQAKRLLRIRGAGHNDLLYVGLREYAQALKDFVQRITK